MRLIFILLCLNTITWYLEKKKQDQARNELFKNTLFLVRGIYWADRRLKLKKSWTKDGKKRYTEVKPIEKVYQQEKRYFPNTLKAESILNQT